MILLDTNVISEVIRPAPDRRVAAWMASQPRQSLLTSAIVRAEILYGFAIISDGKRHRSLLALAEAIFDEVRHVLPITAEAAAHYAELTAKRRRVGRPIGGFDALIAATALAAGTAIATRDTAGFEDCGLTLINPWETTT